MPTERHSFMCYIYEKERQNERKKRETEERLRKKIKKERQMNYSPPWGDALEDIKKVEEIIDKDMECSIYFEYKYDLNGVTVIKHINPDYVPSWGEVLEDVKDDSLDLGMTLKLKK